MQRWESDWFDKLGDDIMRQLELEVDPIDPVQRRLLGHDTPEKRQIRLKAQNAIMKSTLSRCAYGDYPWNPVSLAFETSALHYLPSVASCYGSQIISFFTLILSLSRVSVLPVRLKERFTDPHSRNSIVRAHARKSSLASANPALGKRLQRQLLAFRGSTRKRRHAGSRLQAIYRATSQPRHQTGRTRSIHADNFQRDDQYPGND